MKPLFPSPSSVQNSQEFAHSTKNCDEFFAHWLSHCLWFTCLSSRSTRLIFEFFHPFTLLSVAWSNSYFTQKPMNHFFSLWSVVANKSATPFTIFSIWVKFFLRSETPLIFLVDSVLSQWDHFKVLFFAVHSWNLCVHLSDLVLWALIVWRSPLICRGGCLCLNLYSEASITKKFFL